MKKVFAALLAVGILAVAAATPAWAQGKKAEVVLSVGAITLYGSDITFGLFGLTGTVQVDVHVTKGFLISPECMFVTNVGFSGILGLPGLTLNYYGRGFFIGAGAVLPIAVSEGLGVSELLPKVQIGYHGRRSNLSVFTITTFDGLFRYGLVGVSLGYRF